VGTAVHRLKKAAMALRSPMPWRLFFAATVAEVLERLPKMV
jgi:hypothetical protein